MSVPHFNIGGHDTNVTVIGFTFRALIHEETCETSLHISTSSVSLRVGDRWWVSSCDFYRALGRPTFLDKSSTFPQLVFLSRNFTTLMYYFHFSPGYPRSLKWCSVKRQLCIKSRGCWLFVVPCRIIMNLKEWKLK